MEDNSTPSIFDDLESQRPFTGYASQGQRFGNHVIDLVVFYIFFTLALLVIELTIGAITGAAGTVLIFLLSSDLALYSVILVMYIIYYTLWEGASKGRTAGKLATRTRAVNATDFSPITWKQAFLRSLVRVIPFEPLSAMGGTPWHDKWTGTTIIRK